ncbi:hypothetical protein GAY33_10700 [Azospirillum brasilense]|uniref:hypothetical protein n=1 Tax=Azospirillum argentinense TaxID=2970906 RepID=UPI00190A40B4|nr:hypothetical protein [Azospirillum argentinense]MBK3799694.1 hypothetical protein [Azospirillum argentinense]
MNQRVRQPPNDPFRKARFREEARGIIAKDRYDRKDGLAVDTAGAVARALERAYRQGFTDAQGEALPAPVPPDGVLEWSLIPPRPRSAFWSCCLSLFGRQDTVPRKGHLVPDRTGRGTDGWRLVVPGYARDDVFGGKTIAPLVKLGLLEPDPEAVDRLVLSVLGKATWKRFVDRGGKYPDDLTQI